MNIKNILCIATISVFTTLNLSVKAQESTQTYTLEVIGKPVQHGSSQPCYGEHTDLQANSYYDCSLSMEGVASTDDTIITFKGYELYSVNEDSTKRLLQTGIGQSFSYFHSGNAQLIWLFDTEYKINITQSNEGTISSSKEWVKHGEYITLTATGAEGKAFSQWIGVPEKYKKINPISLPITETKSISAIFDDCVYVDATTGSDSNTGAIDSPFKTISYASTHLPNNTGTIFVYPGSYKESYDSSSTAAIFITNEVSIIGLGNNPSEVIISANDGRRCFYINHPNALLQNITMANCVNRINNGVNNDICGGNVFINSNGGIIYDCIISNGNAATWNAGGGNIYIKGGLVSRCTIVGGKASTGTNAGRIGGANILIEGGIVENCLIKDGFGAAAGARLINNGLLINCTIVNNSNTGELIPQNNATNDVGVVRATGNARVQNCIIYNNTSNVEANGHSRIWAGSLSCFINNATDGDYPISENNLIIMKGMFVNEDNKDYHITLPSTAFDNGKIENTESLIEDLDGNPRVIGNRIDIGCYELVVSDNQPDFVVDSNDYVTDKEITFYANALTDCSVSYEWDFGDGETATGKIVNHTYDTPGLYSVTLTTYINGEPISITKENFITISYNILYVDVNSINPISPYSSKATAAKTIAEALTHAKDGSTIIILPGTYSLSDQVNVEKAVTIQGESKLPSNTIISTSKSTRHFYLNNKDALISGLTLQDGVSSANGASVYIASNGGSISNCVFRNNYAYNFDGTGAAIYASTPYVNISHIQVYNSRFQRYKQRAKGVVELHGGGVIKDSFIQGASVTEYPDVGNYYMAALILNGATAINCTVVGTRAYFGYGIYLANAKSYAVNCVVADCVNLVRETVDGSTTTLETKSSFKASTVNNVINCASDIENDSTIYANNFVYAPISSIFLDYENADYRIPSHSPLINSGTNVYVSKLDLRGAPRITDDIIDIGCFEARSNTTLIMIK